MLGEVLVELKCVHLFTSELPNGEYWECLVSLYCVTTNRVDLEKQHKFLCAFFPLNQVFLVSCANLFVRNLLHL